MATSDDWIRTAIRLEHRGYVGGAERDTTGYL